MDTSACLLRTHANSTNFHLNQERKFFCSTVARPCTRPHAGPRNRALLQHRCHRPQYYYAVGFYTIARETLPVRIVLIDAIARSRVAMWYKLRQMRYFGAREEMSALFLLVRQKWMRSGGTGEAWKNKDRGTKAKGLYVDADP